jgi:hypothetical protein
VSFLLITVGSLTTGAFQGGTVSSDGDTVDSSDVSFVCLRLAILSLKAFSSVLAVDWSSLDTFSLFTFRDIFNATFHNVVQVLRIVFVRA